MTPLSAEFQSITSWLEQEKQEAYERLDRMAQEALECARQLEEEL